MDKMKHSAMIEFFVKKDLAPMEIHSKMISVLGDTAPLEIMIVSGYSR